MLWGFFFFFGLGIALCIQWGMKKIVEKILEGKLKAFYDQVCLLNQKYVKDNSISIAQLLENESKAAGKSFTIKSFLRWQVGE